MKKHSKILISGDKLSIDTCYQEVVDEACGGICLFVGTVRNHNKGKDVTHLEFETYEGMAVKEMQKIADHCLAEIGAQKVAIFHRSGHVGITDIAVIIAVSSIHRVKAFEACQYCIDTLKETVPIWKKEFLHDGSYWVGARP